MSGGRLTEKDMNDIEEMIGEGKKRFTLLYSITRDACDPGIFHRFCDDKGPTVTMLYNTKDSVFGFYTSIDWQSEGDWKVDRKHFMIQLRYLGHQRFTKFLTKGAVMEICCSEKHGPYSRGVLCFSGKTHVPNNGVFALNTTVSFSSDYYDTHGLSASDVTNGTTQFTELEVYKVADRERMLQPDIECPWRTQPEWNAKNVSKLSAELSAIAVSSTKPRLLLLGPKGAGKSSFINIVASALAGRMVRLANCGTGGQTVTTKYSTYQLHSTRGSPIDVKLCDTPGLEIHQGIDTRELHFLLDGHIPDGYDFNPTKHITLKSPGFVFEPKVGDRVHCVAMVVDATTVENMDGAIQDQLKQFKQVIFEKDISLTVLLTKVDKVSDNAHQKLDEIFMNPDVGKLVYKMAELLGLPQNVVFPIKNYEREMEPVVCMNTLALVALKNMIEIASDRMSQSHDIEGAEGGAETFIETTNWSDTA